MHNFLGVDTFCVREKSCLKCPSGNYKLQKPFLTSNTLQVENILQCRKVVLQQGDQINSLHLYAVETFIVDMVPPPSS